MVAKIKFLVVTKVNASHQGFVVGYDIEIYVTVFFIKVMGDSFIIHKLEYY